MIVRKILIIYYSRTGFTSTVANEIANSCGADLESIRDIRRRFDGKSYLRLVFEAAMHSDTLIRRVRYAPDNYDVVVIGTPIWCWNVSNPIRTYIKIHRHQFKRIAFFFTYGGSGQVKIFQDLEKLAGQTPIARLAVKDSDIKNERQHEEVKEFTAKLKNCIL